MASEERKCVLHKWTEQKEGDLLLTLAKAAASVDGALLTYSFDLRHALERSLLSLSPSKISFRITPSFLKVYYLIFGLLAWRDRGGPSLTISAVDDFFS